MATFYRNMYPDMLSSPRLPYLPSLPLHPYASFPKRDSCEEEPRGFLFLDLGQRRVPPIYVRSGCTSLLRIHHRRRLFAISKRAPVVLPVGVLVVVLVRQRRAVSLPNIFSLICVPRDGATLDSLQ